MAGVGHRYELNEDVVAFPATKSAGAATIVGTELYPFESYAWGGANVMIEAANRSDIVNTLTIKTYVSFDGGTTDIQVGSDASTLSNAGAVTAFARTFVPFAPRIRVDAVFNGSGALTANHGCQINIESLEYNAESARTLFEDVGNFGDSYAAGDSADGTTMTINSPTKLLVWFGSVATVGDTAFTVTLQGSHDASRWYTLQTISTAVPASASTYRNIYEEIERQDFPKYARIRTVMGDTETPTGHGMKYYVLAVE